MIALDTHILARFYVDGPGDPEAAKQRPIARQILTERPSLFVPLTVVLELECVPRAFNRFETAQIVRVLEHLLGLGHVNTEKSGRTRPGCRFKDWVVNVTTDSGGKKRCQQCFRA